MKAKGGTQTSMKTECRKEDKESEAKTGTLGESPELALKSAEFTQTARDKANLPSTHDPHIATIERVVRDYNIGKAVEAVMRNKGAPGVDGVTIKEINGILRDQWPKIKQDILEGKYRPSPVRRVEIPKPDGKGIRQLGIPTVLDRIIQQALYQELVLVFEPTFSSHSYGFRPGRNAKQALLQAQKYIEEGYEWVVDIDLEKFFDKVNHDVLMAKIVRRVKDKKILLLIRRLLQAGVMEAGLVKPTEEGTPQGGPLSPLLSNIMLDDFDKNLEKRGLRFVRYADDCNTYVKTERAGKRVMEVSVRYLMEELKLKVNQQKSGVDNPWNQKFLGFTFTKGKPRIMVHKSRIKRLKDKIKGLTKKMRGSNLPESIREDIMPIIRGWINYFGIAEIRSIFNYLDGWIRRKIRSILWRQWKKPRTRYKQLRRFGLSEASARMVAYGNKGPWRMAKTPGMHKALSNKNIEKMGYFSMIGMVEARS